MWETVDITEAWWSNHASQTLCGYLSNGDYTEIGPVWWNADRVYFDGEKLWHVKSWALSGADYGSN